MSEKLRQDDRRLLTVVDSLADQAAGAAGPHLTCHRGCTPCCFGPFAITQLDAWRLRQGLAALEATDPARAAALHRRAHLAASEQVDAFPPARVGTFADEAEELRFYAAFAEAPCPVLDPDSGACLLYRWRPVVCRTHGPPLRERDGDVAHCPLCFTTATPAQIEAARTTVDVDDIERPLVERVEQETGQRGMTSVTFALAEAAPAR